MGNTNSDLLSSLGRNPLWIAFIRKVRSSSGGQWGRPYTDVRIIERSIEVEKKGRVLGAGKGVGKLNEREKMENGVG